MNFLKLNHYKHATTYTIRVNCLNMWIFLDFNLFEVVGTHKKKFHEFEKEQKCCWLMNRWNINQMIEILNSVIFQFELILMHNEKAPSQMCLTWAGIMRLWISIELAKASLQMIWSSEFCWNSRFLKLRTIIECM